MPELPYGLKMEEVPEYLEKFYQRLLEHRYRYYVLDVPVIEDWIYDYLEKEYNRIAGIYNGKLMDMVDFDLKDPLALAAKNRVDLDEDYHSLWEKEMQPVWNKLGKSRKIRKKEEEEKDK